MKIKVDAYGCPSNLADAEVIRGILSKKGYELGEDANLAIVLTCSVKVPTVNRMLDLIKKMKKKFKYLIIGGCLPLTYKEKIEKIAPNASLISPDWIDKIDEVVEKVLKGEKVVWLEERKKVKLGLPRCRKNKVIGVVQIGRGCVSNCSFCNEPFRGKLFSYPIASILKEIKTLLKDGCKEIWLTSLDTGCYGFDRNYTLIDLLRKITSLKGKFWVRIGMMNPNHPKKFGVKNLLECLKNDKFFNFLHLPLQSGSDRILKLMNRNYTSKEFLELVKEIREEFPNLSLATDIIIGFPTETTKDFNSTLKLLKKIQPDFVNISKFGAHPNTLAKNLRMVNSTVIKKRSKKATEFVRKLLLKRNKEWRGWKGEVLVDEKGKNNTFIARNYAYKPIVLKGKKLLGKRIKVEIVDAKPNYLIANPL